MPKKYVHNMTSEMVLFATSLIHMQTQAVSDIEDQIEESLQKKKPTI